MFKVFVKVDVALGYDLVFFEVDEEGDAHHDNWVFGIGVEVCVIIS